METPPDPDVIARAFMEEELAKDRPKPEGVPADIPHAEVAPRAESLPASAPPVTEAEPFKFVLPRLGQNKKIRYQAADGSVYEITKKPGGYRITKEGDPAIASTSRTEIMQRGQAENWVPLGAASPAESRPDEKTPEEPSVVPPAPAANEGRARFPAPFEIEQHLTVLRRGQELRYTNVDGSIFIVTRVSDQAVFQVLSPDGTIRLHPLREMVEIIDGYRWRFHSKGRAETAAEPIVAQTPEKNGQETSLKIEKRLAGLKAGRAIVYEDENGGLVTVSNANTKNPEVELDYNLQMMQSGDTKVFTVTQPDGTESIQSFRELGERISKAGWKFRRTRDLARMSDSAAASAKQEEPTEPLLKSPAPHPEATAASAASQAEAGPTETPEPEAEASRPNKAPVNEQPPRETVRLIEMNGVQIPENEITVADMDAKIAKLREEVASERAAFIAVEESQRGTWKNLSRIFRGLSHKDSDDIELMKYRAFYDEKVAALQNAELEKLKRSGKTIKELRPEMAALIREFEFEEAERIYAARQEMRLAKTNQPLLEKMKSLWDEAEKGINGPTAKGEVKAWIKLFAGGTGAIAESALQGLEKGGVAYNKLMRSKAGKLILGATILGSGAVVLGIGTGGVGAVAVGALALKRMAAGAGVAVTTDQAMDMYANYRRKKKRDSVETKHEATFDAMENEEDLEIKLGNKKEIDFSKLEEYLKKVSAETRKGEGARRRGDLYRKSAAIFAGVVLGSGSASYATRFASEYIGIKAHAAPIGKLTVPDEGASASPEEGGAAAGGPGDVAQADQSAKVAEQLKGTREIPTPPVESPVTTVSSGMRELLETHEVKRGESVWKLATKAVEGAPGMDGRSSERFAKLVELKLQAKLEASPELARAAGFTPDADGKFSPHLIQKGAKLELGKLFSADEMTKLMGEAKSGTPIAVPETNVPSGRLAEAVSAGATGEAAVLPPSAAEITARETARIEKQIPVPSADEKAAILATFPESPTTELIKPTGNVMKYIETLPREEQEKLFRNFKRISTELLQTNEVMGGEVYDMRYDPAAHPEIAKAKFSAVLADHKLLSKAPLSGYDRMKNPLHWSQMEEMAKFAKTAGKAFGDSVAVPKSTESVQEYVLRMVAIARNQGVKISGVRMID